MSPTLRMLAFLAVFLIACGAPPSVAQPATTRVAERSPVPAQVSPTPTFASTATSTPATQPSPSATPTAFPTPSPTLTPIPPQHRIGVRVVNGQGEFFDRVTGTKFIPRGNNYIRLANTQAPCVESGTFYHSTFNAGLYDSARTERAFSKMQQDGFNTVRVFLNQLCTVTRDGALSAPYFDNVADLLRLARAHGLFVILATDDPPGPGYKERMRHNDQIDYANRTFLAADGVEIEARYWTDIVHALLDRNAPFDAILAFQPRQEMFYSGGVPPFSLASGIVETGNGKRYDMSDSLARTQMMDDNFVFWIDRIRSRILEADPTALVTVGFFVPQSPHPARIGDNRLTRPIDAIARSSADFIDLHPYPGMGLSLVEYADNFGLSASTVKPVLMGEFGGSRSAFASAEAAARALQDWEVASCKFGFDGWLLWTWDADEQTDWFNGMSDGGLIDQVLAPVNRPDPCKPGSFAFLKENVALNKRVQASRWLKESPPSNAVDGMTSDVWNAGDFPPQWIEVDLGKPYNIGEIRLAVSVYPLVAQTVHRVLGKGAGASASYRVLHTFAQETREGSVLDFKPSPPWQGIQYIRIESIESPSWVAWREIEVMATE